MRKIVILSAFALLFLACEKSEQKLEENSSENLGKITIKKGDENVNSQDFWVNYDIYGNKLINFSPNNEQNATTKALGAVALTKPPLQSINKALLRGNLSKNFILKCSACHDDYANGIIGPSLLDKSSDEIYAAIIAYKNKSKKNVLMADLIKNMNEAEIKGFAEEIATFNKQFKEDKK